MDLITVVKGVAFATALTAPVLSLLIFRHKRKQILLALASLATCVSLGEVVLRRVYPQIMDHDALFESDTSLGWRFIPNKRAAIVIEGEARHFVEPNFAKMGMQHPNYVS